MQQSIFVYRFPSTPDIALESQIYFDTTAKLFKGYTGTNWIEFGGGSAPDASESVKGIIEIASTSEVNTGTNDLAAITPLKLKTYVDAGLDTKQSTSEKNQNNGYAGLDSGGKIPLANLPTTLLQYKGVWNASTNTPTLTNPDTTKKGFVYNCSAAGTQFGIDFKLGDWLIYNDSGVPEKSDNSDDVVSVNGQTGVVVLNTSHIADTLDKRYITDAQQTKVNAIDQSVSSAEKSTWNGKQDTLVSATNIKTVNGSSILGSGNLVVSGNDSRIVSLGADVTNANITTYNAAFTIPLDNSSSHFITINLIAETNLAGAAIQVRTRVDQATTTGYSVFKTPTTATAAPFDQIILGTNPADTAETAILAAANIPIPICIWVALKTGATGGNLIVEFQPEVAATSTIKKGSNYIKT